MPPPHGRSPWLPSSPKTQHLKNVKPHSNLPHLDAVERYPIVFITICTAQRRPILSSETCHSILRTLWENSPQHDSWRIGRYVQMPDHLHLFAAPDLNATPLASWVKMWKSVSSRQIASHLDLKPPIWQPGYFDRYLRSDESYAEKWDYVRNNPVRAGLVREPADWPFAGELTELRR